jgi:poly [ADP-ribose] polymerase
MYTHNTHASSHNRYSLEVLNIFAVDRENESERFRKDLHNHMLLWHGSCLTNWVGILSQELRIAPPEAPVTGYMFGKGVYFADMVSKSANYCFTSPSNNIGCLLLCDVALGTCNEKLYADHHAEQLPPDTHSTKGCGKTAPPESTYSDSDGVKVPLGKGEATVHNGSLLYNEYIVYDIAQVRMKSLFVVRFNYH